MGIKVTKRGVGRLDNRKRSLSLRKPRVCTEDSAGEVDRGRFDPGRRKSRWGGELVLNPRREASFKRLSRQR